MKFVPALLLLAACGTEVEPFALAFPVAEQDKIEWLVGVDHDPVVQEPGLAQGICESYRGQAVPNCYDEHDGSDFLLTGGFETMDDGSATVVAAADGIVVATHDGEYDRCHFVQGSVGVDCDGFPMRANAVTIEHEDGFETRYWHLKSGSVQVTVGQAVRCGEVLGLVGSSGNSSMPHLHFGLRQDDQVIDPYAGKYSQERSYWTEQHIAGELWPGSGCQ